MAPFRWPLLRSTEISRPKFRDVPPKSLVCLGFEELCGPHTFTWKTPLPTRRYPETQKFWVWRRLLQGLKSWGLAPKVLQSLWGCAEPSFNKLFKCQGFSNVPWRKRAFGPGTKYVFLDLFLGILGALCTGKGAPLVRYLCTT